MECHVSCQSPHLDSELIQLCIRVLQKSDYLGIGLTVSNQIVYWVLQKKKRLQNSKGINSRLVA